MSHRKATPALHLDLSTPVNESRPLRIALLGGPKSGKLSIVARLSFDQVPDTYYPTHATSPELFQFVPRHSDLVAILDVAAAVPAVRECLLSPVLFKALAKKGRATNGSGGGGNGGGSGGIVLDAAAAGSRDLLVKSSTDYYKLIADRKNALATVSPILVEFIDTPAFNPDQVVPFLEASLYMKLDLETLRNLANEPPRPVLTNPLLVASGAGEMNGYIDGYFFVYLAIPLYTPPQYSEAPVQDAVVSTKRDTNLGLLLTIKETLDEAWAEYNSYRRGWAQGLEGDIFLIKGALRGFWGKKSLPLHMGAGAGAGAGRNDSPPIWVLCTHVGSPLALQKLVAEGKSLARKWGCGFVAVDSMEEDGEVEEALALMIREIVERSKA